jgi:hypothetical protein
MAYLVNQVRPDSISSDAFGRMRTAEPTTLLSVNFEYDTQPLLTQTVNVGAGTAVKTTNVSSVTLSTGGNTSGDGSIFQSKMYARHEPGKSQLVQMTGVIGAAKANVRSQIGYYDANNGVFFDMNNGMNVTVRTHTSGSVSDAAVAQASWNIDTMSGSGLNPSGITLDFSKAQIFIIDLQWLGAGRIRFGFVVNGVLYYCHQVLNANLISLPYMNTAVLPVRYEIHNTGAASGATTMTAGCMSVISEGGNDSSSGYEFSAGNGITGIAVTTRRPILSIQPKTTFNSITNRSRTLLQTVELSVTGNTALVEVVYNGTLTGASFASADANSGVNFDVGATAISGGTVLYSGYIATSGATRVTLTKSVIERLPLTLDAAGSTPDTLSVVITSFTGTATTNAQMSWTEDR